MRRRWQYRRVGSAITLSKPTADTDGVPAGPDEVGWVSRDSHSYKVACAHGSSQSDAHETDSGTPIKRANRRADIRSRTDIGAIGNKESLEVTNPRGEQHDPDRDCSTESVDRHPVGDRQRIADRKPIADCKPVAVPICGR